MVNTPRNKQDRCMQALPQTFLKETHLKTALSYSLEVRHENSTEQKNAAQDSLRTP